MTDRRLSIERLRELRDQVLYREPQIPNEGVQLSHSNITGETYLLVQGWVGKTTFADHLRLDVYGDRIRLLTQEPGTAGWVAHGAFDTYEEMAEYVLNME